MYIQSDETLESLQRRLRRIEGQVQGVRRMLDESRDCREVVQQLAAIRAAVHQAGLEVLRVYAAQCLADPARAGHEQEVIDYLVDTLGRWT